MSYNRVLSITKSLYDVLSQNYSREGTFIPTKLRKGCFVIFAVKKDESPLHPLHWLEEKSKTSGMCYFRRMVINLQIEILIYVLSLCESNFPIYVQTTRNLLKWFFALDHYTYARWLTVHVFDLLTLPITHPDQGRI